MLNIYNSQQFNFLKKHEKRNSHGTGTVYENKPAFFLNQSHRPFLQNSRYMIDR